MKFFFQRIKTLKKGKKTKIWGGIRREKKVFEKKRLLKKKKISIFGKKVGFARGAGFFFVLNHNKPEKKKKKTGCGAKQHVSVNNKGKKNRK